MFEGDEVRYIDVNGIYVHPKFEEWPVSLWIDYETYRRTFVEPETDWRETDREDYLPIVGFIGGAFLLRFRSEDGASVFKLRWM